MGGQKTTPRRWPFATATVLALGLAATAAAQETRRSTGSSAAATVTTIQADNITYRNNSIVDTLTWQRGDHTWKFGDPATFEQKNENANNNAQGLFASGGGRTAFQNFLTGNRDGLCGSACTCAEAQIDATHHLRWKRSEVFAQDIRRIRPNITIDLGVRYGLYPGVADINNILSTFVPSDPR